MKISISPRTMITITLLGATFSTANVVAMKPKEEQPRQLSELEKDVQKAIQTVQQDIAQKAWKDPKQAASITKNISQRAEIKEAAQEINKKQQELCACLQAVLQNLQQYKIPIIAKLEEAEKLIDRYTVNAHDKSSEGRETPLIIALSIISLVNALSTVEPNEPDDLIMKMLNAGANPNLGTHTNVTPLMLASLFGLALEFDALLKAEADPCKSDTNQNTTLHYVAMLSVPRFDEELESRKLEIAQKLLLTQIDLFQKDKFGRTAASVGRGKVRSVITEKMIEKTTAQNAENYMGEISKALAGIYDTKGRGSLVEKYRAKIKDVKADLLEKFDALFKDFFIKATAINALTDRIGYIMEKPSISSSGDGPRIELAINEAVSKILTIEDPKIKKSAEEELRTLIKSIPITRSFIAYFNQTIQEQTKTATQPQPEKGPQ